MPYKSIEIRRLNQKLQKQKKRAYMDCLPLSPQKPVEPINSFFHDIRRFELLFDTIRMRELLSKKTNFNLWMNKHIDILDELKSNHINEYKTNVLKSLKSYLATINNVDNI
jgi:hypothetical protein